MKVDLNKECANHFGVDEEKIRYLLLDGLSKTNTVGELCDYVRTKEWTNNEKAAVMITHGSSLMEDERSKVTYDFLFSVMRLYEVTHPRTLSVSDADTDKVSILTTFEKPELLLQAAQELDCGLEAYASVGMMLKLM
jgi:hypothetical protein